MHIPPLYIFLLKKISRSSCLLYPKSLNYNHCLFSSCVIIPLHVNLLRYMFELLLSDVKSLSFFIKEITFIWGYQTYISPQYE